MISSNAFSAVLLVCLLSLAGCHKQGNEGSAAAPGVIKEAQAAATKPISSPWSKTYDGPFGLASGIPISALEKLHFKQVDKNPDIYVGTPPNPVDGLTDYTILAAPKAGVCRIQARAVVSTVNGSGDQIKAKADRLAEVVGIKYGSYTTKEDSSRESVYVRNPHYWMLGLKKESVAYAYVWDGAKSKQPLPYELDYIRISSEATSLDSGFVSVLYSFKNADACLKELDEIKAKNL